ncbi:MAG TPA: FKBP-type peptidyl-prolyl cis-trans isomerase [Moheibacter sp.]|nr:FKBP-type peptidyl-prolyl cis-trans isomerase [Moheibacter sp.]
MKKIITTVILAAVVVSCNQSGSSMGAIDKLENKDQKAGYAYGMSIGEQVQNYSASLKEDSLNYAELEKGILDYLKADKKTRDSYSTGQQIGKNIQDFIKMQKLEGVVEEKYIVQGLMDVVKKKDALFAKDSIDGFMRQYMQDNVTRLQTANLEKGNKFLEEKKKDSKVKATESGLLYEVVSEGTGEAPNENSIVEVNYSGKTVDGKEFDASKKDEPAKFPLRNVIQGWKEGLQLMKVGSKYKFYIPANLAYGEFGDPSGKIGPNEVLIFDVELVSAEEAPAQPAQQPQLSPEQMEALQRQMQQQQGN